MLNSPFDWLRNRTRVPVSEESSPPVAVRSAPGTDPAHYRDARQRNAETRAVAKTRIAALADVFASISPDA